MEQKRVCNEKQQSKAMFKSTLPNQMAKSTPDDRHSSAHHPSSTELNNLATALITEGYDCDIPMNLYREALKVFDDNNDSLSSQRETDDEEMSSSSLPMPITDECESDTDVGFSPSFDFASRMNTTGTTGTHLGDDLDLYWKPSSLCDGGARAILEPLSLPSSQEPEKQEPRRDSQDKAVISYNMGVVEFRKGHLEEAERWWGVAKQSILHLSQSSHSHGGVIVTPAILNNMGVLHYRRGRIEEALNGFYDALEVGRQLLLKQTFKMGCTALINHECCDEDVKRIHRFIGAILSNIGRVYYAMEKYQESLKVCRESLNMRRIGYGDKDVEVYVTIYNIGLLYHSMGYFEKALHSYELFLNHLTKLSGDNSNGKQESICDRRSRDSVTVLVNILLIYCRKLFFDIASFDIDQELKKLQTTRCLYGYDHHRIPVILNRLALMLSEQQEHKFALMFYLEQYRVEKSLIGRHHPELAFTLNFIGHAYLEQDMLEKAMDAFNRALELVSIKQNKLQQQSQNNFNLPPTQDKRQNRLFHGILLYNQGLVHIRVGAYSKALCSFSAALELKKTALGPTHPDVAAVLHSIGIVQREMGDIPDAMTTFKSSKDIRISVFGKDHETVAQSTYQIGKIHDEMGNLDEAMMAYEETVRVERMTLGMEHPEVAMTLCHIAQIHHARGDVDQSLEVYSEVLTITRNADQSSNGNNRRQQNHHNRDQHQYPSVFTILNTIGNLNLERGNSQEAMRAFTEAGRMMQGQFVVSSVGTSNSGIIDGASLLFAIYGENDGLSNCFQAAPAA